MPPLAAWHDLPTVQRRGVAQLRTIAHRRFDVGHGRFPYEHVAADGHRSDLDSTGLCPVTVEARLSTDHRSCADCKQVRAQSLQVVDRGGADEDLRALSETGEGTRGDPFDVSRHRRVITHRAVTFRGPKGKENIWTFCCDRPMSKAPTQLYPSSEVR